MPPKSIKPVQAALQQYQVNSKYWKKKFRSIPDLILGSKWGISGQTESVFFSHKSVLTLGLFFFNFRVCLVTKTRIKILDNILELF